MKPIEEQTYYEILEVSINATAKEIQRAYEQARETFHSDSVAIYSLFSEEEIGKIQAAIDKAYRVLLEEALRESRDSPPVQMPETQKWEKSSELLQGSNEGGEIKARPPVEVADYRGKSLKQIREGMGMDLQALSMETKVSPKILEWIEDDAFDRLPALVYLKGFLKGYARSLGLDPAKTIHGYLDGLPSNTKKK